MDETGFFPGAVFIVAICRVDVDRILVPSACEEGSYEMMGRRGGMMRGDMMSGGMCPMMGTSVQTDGRALQMRGEMMRAMGEITMKHGRMMEIQP
jgi:hypothetical protein